MIPKILTKAQADTLSELIDNASHIVIVCHVGPDGDAIGSSLALWHILVDLGKNTQIIIPDPYPNDLRFLKGAKDIIAYSQYTDFSKQLLSDADLIFCLDFNEPSRVDMMADALCASAAKKVLIDHHINPQKESFDFIISHPEISSTCELLFRVTCSLGLYDQLSLNAATAIYTGMMTDTGNFTYNSNTSETYIIISELIKKGIDKDAIYAKLHNTNTANKIRLNGYAVSRKMEVFPEYSVAIIALQQRELNYYHYQKGDTEGLVNIPLSMPDIYFSAFVREETNLIKISLRSKGNLPVNKIATEYFGGGGHLNAAGGEFYGTLDEACDTIKNIMPIIGELAQKAKLEL